MTYQVTAEKVNKVSRGDVNGVVRIVGQTQLPQEFITIGETFEEALGRCTIRDDRQKSAIITYKSQLEMFPKMVNRIQDLTNWLNASCAVGGYNRALAASTSAGIIIPELAGVKLSKQGSKEYIEANRRSDEQQQRKDNNNDNNHHQ